MLEFLNVRKPFSVANNGLVLRNVIKNIWHIFHDMKYFRIPFADVPYGIIHVFTKKKKQMAMYATLRVDVLLTYTHEHE